MSVSILAFDARRDTTATWINRAVAHRYRRRHVGVSDDDRDQVLGLEFANSKGAGRGSSRRRSPDPPRVASRSW